MADSCTSSQAFRLTLAAPRPSGKRALHHAHARATEAHPPMICSATASRRGLSHSLSAASRSRSSGLPGAGGGQRRADCAVMKGCLPRELPTTPPCAGVEYQRRRNSKRTFAPTCSVAGNVEYLVAYLTDDHGVYSGVLNTLLPSRVWQWGKRGTLHSPVT